MTQSFGPRGGSRRVVPATVMTMPVRKLRSAIQRLVASVRTLSVYARATGDAQISLGRSCNFGRRVRLRATDGGEIVLGDRVSLGPEVQVIARGGTVIIGDDAFIGTGSIVVSCESIRIGRDALIAEYVVIRDQDHGTHVHPYRAAPLSTSPIDIGNDVWIGAKATVLRGVSIGNECVVGAHALVRSNVPCGSLAVGVPARLKPLKAAAL